MPAGESESFLAFFERLFTADFMPHGHCFYWRPDVVWLHVCANALIALAYFSIPVLLFSFVRRKRAFQFNWMLYLFASFIFWCGVTHVFDIVTLWTPVYRLDGVIRAITALVSVATAILLVPLIPKALALRSPDELEEAYRKLEEENQKSRTSQDLLAKQAAKLEEQASLLELSTDAIIVRDKQGVILFWNRGAEELYGWKRQEAIGQTSLDLLKTKSALPIEAIYRHLAEHARWQGEVTQQKRDGTSVAIAARWVLQKNFGISSGEILEINSDITAEKQAAELVEISRREQYQRSVADVIPQLIWITKPDGQHEYFNHQWFDYTGHVDIGSANEGWVDAVHPDDAAAVSKMWAQSKKTGSFLDVECRFLRHDGSYRWHLCRAVPLKDAHGVIQKWFGTCTDIEPQKQTEHALNVKTRDLARSNRDLEQFAYVSSHDLKEPLRMVTIYVQMLEREYGNQLDDKARQYIRFAAEGATRMNRLIGDLLQYSRLDIESKNKGVVDTNAVVQEVLTLLAPHIREANLEVDIAELPNVRANRTQITQLFQNLISNAIKFRRSEAPYIRISATRQGTFYQFIVEDNGIGIRPEYQHKIFVIFQRLHGRDKYPGTGIGLAICKKIVEGLGGKISIQSEEGQGSSFVFTIPTV
jgi:PAS domain S-box-containing protein